MAGIKMLREGGNLGTASVNYATSDNSALAGQDYLATSGVIEFTNGQSATTIFVPILADGIFETNETFNLQLSNVTGGAVLGRRSEVSVSIVDTTSTATLHSPEFFANEASGTVVISVDRFLPAVGTLALDIIALPGSAQPGSDYVSVSNRITWDDGETGTKFTAIPLVNNALLDGTRTFTIQLASPSPGVLLAAPTNATVTILDDDSPPVVQWSYTIHTVNENAGFIQLTATRSGGTNNITVSFATSNGTALAGTDYVATNGTITFSPAETSKVIPVTILDDYPIEGDESFTVRLSNPLGAAIGAISNSTVTIRDSGYSPEDLYGHSLRISNNESLYADFYAARFTNRLTVFNPAFGPSRAGYVELTDLFAFTSDTNRFPFPIVPGRGTAQIVVYGDGAGQYLQDGIVRTVYATIYENAGATNQPPQAEFSTGIFYTFGTTPPDGGVPSGSGSGTGAGGLALPPTLTNVVVIGPVLIDENSIADYLGTAYFANGTTYTNMTAAWSSSAFSISAAGRLTVGSVVSDTPLAVAGGITYGSITKTGAVAAIVVAVRSPSLQVLGRTNNQLGLQLSGTTGRRYALEVKTNLGVAGNWSPLTTNQILSNSVVQLADPAATNAVRFYRAREF